MKYPGLALHHAVCRGLGRHIKITPPLGRGKGQELHATHRKHRVADLPPINRVQIPAKSSLDTSASFRLYLGSGTSTPDPGSPFN